MNYLNLLERKNYQSFTLKATENFLENGKNLLKKYSEVSIDGLLESNRYVIYLEPGIYDLGTSSLILNKRFVDIIGLDEKNKSIITSNISASSNGTINQLADYVNLSNLSVENTNTTFISPWHEAILTPEDRNFYEERLNLLPSAYFQNFAVGQNFGKTYIENVEFKTLSSSIQSMRIAQSYNGTYKNVIAGNFAFGFKGKANGIFENCIAGHLSFGSFGTEVKGIFNNCTALYSSFGRQATLIKGKFTNCNAKPESFGFKSIQNEGIYNNCKINEDE